VNRKEPASVSVPAGRLPRDFTTPFQTLIKWFALSDKRVVKPDKALIRLAVFAFGLAVGLPCLAQTPEQIEQRLENLRRMDAEAARRRQETLEFQARRKREEYARRWKRYGDEEIDFLKWRQQKDGTWVTEVKELERSGNSTTSTYFELPAPSTYKIWVKVRQPISVEELSTSLKVDEERIAKLNDVNKDHTFRQGDWLVVPSQQSRQIKQLAAIDTSELRRSPPLQSLPPVEDRTVVRFGDTMLKIAQRYGLTLQEILRLNPGLETVRLVVGSQVRVRSSLVPLAKPLGPDGAGDLQSRPPIRFDAALDALVRDGVVSPTERARIRSGPFPVPAHPQACRSGQLSHQECTSGLIVRWHGVNRVAPHNDVKTFQDSEAAKALIGISCKSLMVNRKPSYMPWGHWTRPEKGSTDEQLIIDRCSTKREGS